MVQPPLLLRWLFPYTVWRKSWAKKEVYLTFDDGPVEKETTWVINTLATFGIKATFFCVGENAHRHPHLMKLLVDNGHSVGNHSYNHLPAWRCSRKAFFDNVDKAKPYIKSSLFRPPHGQLYPWYVPLLKRRFKHIVMWDVLSKDYDASLSAEQVTNNVLNHVRNGSVIVFHDSKKAWDRLQVSLPVCLTTLQERGYEFKLFEM